MEPTLPERASMGNAQRRPAVNGQRRQHGRAMMSMTLLFHGKADVSELRPCVVFATVENPR
jgi:hypothetical protein